MMERLLDQHVPKPQYRGDKYWDIFAYIISVMRHIYICILLYNYRDTVIFDALLLTYVYSLILLMYAGMYPMKYITVDVLKI